MVFTRSRKVSHTFEEGSGENIAEFSSSGGKKRRAVEVGSIDSSSLEQRRLKNLEENAKFLAELNIGELKELHHRAPRKQPSNLGIKIAWKQPEREPVRLRSLRSRQQQATANNAEEDRGQPAAATADDTRVRTPQGTLSLPTVWLNKKPNESLAAVLHLNEDSPMSCSSTGLPGFIKSLDKMTLNERSVVKVVRNRIYSLAVHPGERACPIIAAGDKWGQVGIWKVNSGADGVLVFDLHTSPVNCLSFKRDDEERLYSCSYDGTLRCCMFERELNEELYRTEDFADTRLMYFDFESAHCLLVAQTNGCVLRIDQRSRAVVEHNLNAGTLKTISIHPQERDYFATASANGQVHIWDARMLSGKRHHSVIMLPSSRAVHSAFFSSLTGDSLLTTSADDTLRLYDTSDLTDVKLTRSIRHNNFTGRWLTNFRAVWHPARDDAFVVGSMVQPRQIEVFNSSGEIVNVFRSDFLGSVCSINAFHPTMNLLVGGNSSGRLHLFK